MTQILERVSDVSLLALLDILLVAVLIYAFLVLVKGTGGFQVLGGAAVLVLAFFAARLFHLHTVNWLFTTLGPYAMFALIVVFQAEIRQALGKLGRIFAFTRGPQAAASDSYDDIVLAANLFAQNQTGALIVIERETGLRTYIESGVPLDARLGYDLLVSVFRPGSPLHDGAVIVQADRIAAAACFLPLSMTALGPQLGTRHRAAVGITEDTDAIAIAVSEETGAISLSVAGKIERDITVEYLRQRLGELLHRYLPPAALPTPISAPAEVEPARSMKPGVEP
ncbi:MAG: diadenylate cyclase CdaA [Acidobacteria bacterium]|nr:diadenylate cyclase CdaA [Acidobacteriota bacterium]